METYIYWFLITLAAVFVGMGKGGLPVIATLGVPSLSLIMSPITAAGLLLPVYIVSDIFALSAYRRDFSWPVLKIGMVGMTLGVVVGGLTASYVIEWVVTLLIGLMGFLFALSTPQKTKITEKEKCSNKFYKRLFLVHYRRLHELHKPHRRPSVANFHYSIRTSKVSFCRHLRNSF